MTNNHGRRLIEVSLPLKPISAQSAREKSIRHGHISTLHIWWARRPLAASSARPLHRRRHRSRGPAPGLRDRHLRAQSRRPPYRATTDPFFAKIQGEPAAQLKRRLQTLTQRAERLLEEIRHQDVG